MNKEIYQMFKENLMRRVKNRQLNLSDCALGPEAAAVIAKRLMMHNFHFSSYDLHSNSIGDDGL